MNFRSLAALICVEKKEERAPGDLVEVKEKEMNFQTLQKMEEFVKGHLPLFFPRNLKFRVHLNLLEFPRLPTKIPVGHLYENLGVEPE